MDSSGSGQGPLAGSPQNRNQSPGSIKDVNLQRGYTMLANYYAHGATSSVTT